MPLPSDIIKQFDSVASPIGGTTGEPSKSLTDQFDAVATPIDGGTRPSGATPGFWPSVGAGLLRGAEDVGDTLAAPVKRFGAWVDQKVPALAAIDQQTGMDKPIDRSAEDQKFAGSNAYALSRLVGNVGATIPLIAGGEGVIGAAADAAGGVLPEAAGAVARGVGNFVTGQGGSGLIGKGASSVAKGAIEGAAASGLTGGAAGPDAEDMASGAKLGALLGPVGGATAKALGYTGRTALSATGLLPSTGSLAAKSAVSKVMEALQRDGLPFETALNTIRDMGPGTTLADVGGANTRNLAESIANKPGPGAQVARTVLEDRAAAQPERAEQAIREATGVTQGYHDVFDDLDQQRRTAAAPKYEAAFAEPVTMDQVRPLQRIITDPIGQEALQKGMRIAELESLAQGRMFNPEDYGVTRSEQTGNFIVDPDIADGKKAPSMRMLDAVKRGYDEIVEGFRDPTSGRLNLNQYGRAVNNVRAAYTGALRDTFPKYADALDAWAGPSQSLDALNLGKRALGPDPEITAKTIGRLSDTDKQFFKLGVYQALRGIADGTKDGANAVRRLFGTPAIRAKIAAAFDDPAAFDKFSKWAETEDTWASTKNDLLRNSATARRLAGQQDLTPINMLPHVLRAAHGDVLGAAKGLAGEGVRQLAGPSPEIESNIAKMLFAQDPDALAATMRQHAPGAFRRAAAAAATIPGRSVAPAAAIAIPQRQSGAP